MKVPGFAEPRGNAGRAARHRAVACTWRRSAVACPGRGRAVAGQWPRWALALGRGLVLVGLLGLTLAGLIPGLPPGRAVAASPSPVAPYGDTRTSGEGAGLVGSPIGVALAVVLVGLGAAGATMLYVRLRDDR